MIDATQVSYIATAKWRNPPTPELGEELSSKMTLHVEFLDGLATPELVGLLTSQAVDTWCWAIEQRMGKPPPDDARLAVTLSLNAATGKPIGYLCTLVEDEAPEPQAD